MNEDGSTACQCPDPKACPPVYKRVCANNKKTYDNECKMKADACLQDKILGVLKRRPCRKFPGLNGLYFLFSLLFLFCSHLCM